MGVGGKRHAPAAFTPGKEPVSIVQEAGWAAGPVWIGAENLAPTGIRSPDLPARYTDWAIPASSPQLTANTTFITSTDIDWGVFSWPWQLSTLGEKNRPSFVCDQYPKCFSYKYIQLKCSCVLCVSDNSFFLWCSRWLEWWLSWLQTCCKRRKTTSCSHRDLCIWQNLYVPPPPDHPRECKGILPTQWRLTAFSWVTDITVFNIH
jgi:hypothetical protein